MTGTGAAPHAPVTTVAAALAARLAGAGLDWIVPAWPAPARVGALSTTRAGGVSTGSAATMDLRLGSVPGTPCAPTAEVAENRRRLDAFLPASPVWLSQVHGAGVAVLDAGTLAAARAAPPVADAAVTRERGVVCAVRTADCLPVLFADRAGTVAGAAHAGWRGLVAGVLEATVAALAALGAAPGDLVAWLGPAIGPAAFEVGDDVRDAFAASDPQSIRCFAPAGEGKWLADLYALARRRLAGAGVREVSGGGLCTVADATRFYSHRRARDTARMATLVWLAPGAGEARI
jgi:YfiH family protein